MELAEGREMFDVIRSIGQYNGNLDIYLVSFADSIL